MCIVSIFEIVLIKPKPAQLRYLPEARILIGQLLVTCLDTVLWLVNILVLALKHRNIVAEWLIMVLMLTIHCSDPLIYSTLVNTALSNLQKKGCGDADIENRNFVKISSIWWFWIFLKWFLTIFFVYISILQHSPHQVSQYNTADNQCPLPWLWCRHHSFKARIVNILDTSTMSGNRSICHLRLFYAFRYLYYCHPDKLLKQSYFISGVEFKL